MPWTSEQHAAALLEITTYLDAREAAGYTVDRSDRVVEAMALETVGGAETPRRRLTATGTRRALSDDRYQRWSTVVWRARLARTVTGSRARRDAWAAGDPYPAGLTGNRAQRRAAQRRARHAR